MTNPINGWDRRLGAVAEATFGTTPAPADVAAYAGRFGEVITANLGPVEQGAVRAKKDRNLGRGMTAGYVEGRVQPIPFTVDLSLRSRPAVDGNPVVLETALYKAAGLKKTVNAATSVIYSTSATPIESSDFASISLLGFLGQGLATYLEEVLRGCVVRTLRWEGGDKEVTLRATGAGIGKYTSGRLDSVTLASGVVTTLTHTAEESYRLAPGYYLCESEIILIAAVADIGYGTTSTTITRGALASTPAAHTAQPLVPYIPAGISFLGAPIAEPTAAVTIGGVTLRALSYYLDFTTGMDLLPGETGSKYIQGAKYVRYALSGGVRAVAHASDVSLLGKAQQRATAGALALSIAQGSGAGGIATWAAPYCEVEPFSVPDPVNDVSTADIKFRTRENAGSDLFTLTLT